MVVETFKCDICGKVKGEENHWFCATGQFTPDAQVVIGSWHSRGKFPEPHLVRHLCGMDCAQKFMHKILEGK